MACFTFLRKVFYLKISNLMKFTFFPEDVPNFFRSLVKNIVDTRKQTGNTRKDFMQLMIQLREKGTLTVDDDDEKENATEHQQTDFSTMQIA
jgi:Sec-independent protein translocase protein TatA